MTPETKQAQAVSLFEAMGKGRPLEWNGKTVVVEPFDMNDIADLEDALGGDVSRLDIGRIRHQQIVLWIALRKLDETLTPDQRAYCRYNLTLQDCGRLVSAKTLREAKVFAFIMGVIRVSGLFGGSDADETAESGAAPKNADAASDSQETSSSPSS